LKISANIFDTIPDSRDGCIHVASVTFHHGTHYIDIEAVEHVDALQLGPQGIIHSLSDVHFR